MADPLRKLATTVDFERFRPILEMSSARHRDANGVRPALDAVLKFKMPVLQSLRRLLPEATEVTVRARPTKLHFCGLEPNETVQDANTLWDFREALTEAGTLKDLFGELKRIIAEAGSSGLMLIGMAFFKHSLFSARLPSRFCAARSDGFDLLLGGEWRHLLYGMPRHHPARNIMASATGAAQSGTSSETHSVFSLNIATTLCGHSGNELSYKRTSSAN